MSVDPITVVELEVEPFYTPQALARRLNVSERTVRDMLAQRKIRSYKVEGSRRIDPADVRSYLAANLDEE